MSKITDQETGISQGQFKVTEVGTVRQQESVLLPGRPSRQRKVMSPLTATAHLCDQVIVVVVVVVVVVAITIVITTTTTTTFTTHNLHILHLPAYFICI